MNQKRKIFKSIVFTSIFLFACFFANNARADDKYEVVSLTASTTTVRIYSENGDGMVINRNENWRIARESELGVGFNYLDTTSSIQSQSTNSNSDFAFHRTMLPFKTQLLSQDSEILKAKLIVHTWQVLDPVDDGYDYITAVQSFQASSTSLSFDDYGKCGDSIDSSEEGIEERKDLGDIIENEYLSFDLNDTGMGWINRDGYTSFGLREGHDIDNIPMRTHQTNGIRIYTSEHDDKSKRPYLEITYRNVQEEHVVHPVVLVHGLMGSIEKDGKRLIDPIFHTFDNLITAMVHSGYELNKDLFIFKYDWRKDNIETATLLKQKIAEVKENTGFDNVDVVAHSMGGLVSRSYIESDDYVDDIDQLIMLGVPQQGAPSAYLAWSGAHFYGGFSQIKKFKFLTETITNGYPSLVEYIRDGCPSSGQILPVYDYLYDKVGDGWVTREYGPQYPENLFLENLHSEASLNLLNERAEVITFISEDGYPGDKSTLNGIRVVNDPDSGDEKWEHGYPDVSKEGSFVMGDGDAIVPNESLEFLGVGETISSVNSNHHEIITKSQQNIIEKLRNEEVSDYFEGPIGIVERVLFVRAYSPIDFQVIDPDGKIVGKNFSSSTEENDIDGAFYSGFHDEAEFVTIPNPIMGEYRILVQATGSGRYGIGVNVLSFGEYQGDNIYWGNTVEGEAIEFTFKYEEGDAAPIINLIEDEEELSGFDKLIQDTKDLYKSGDIKRGYIKKVLLNKFKHLKRFQEKHQQPKCKFRKTFYGKVVEVGLNWSKKILNHTLEKEKITAKAHKILTDDINSILEYIFNKRHSV